MQHRTIAGALAAAAVLTLAGCGSDNDSDKDRLPGAQAPVGQAPFDNAPTTPTGPPAPVAVGQPVTLLQTSGSGITMTALKVLDPATAVEPYGKPPAGERLVAVQWKITASGTLAISSSPAMGSSLIDDQGQEYPTSTRPVSAGPAFASSVSIAVGDSRLGWVSYLVSADAKITKIQYAPGAGLAEHTGTWTL